MYMNLAAARRRRRSAGGGSPPQIGNLTIGEPFSGTFGYIQGQAGSVVPDTVNGVPLFYILNLDANELEVTFQGQVQLPGVTTITATVPGFGPPITLTWVGGGSDPAYIGPAPGIGAYFAQNLGITVPFGLSAVAQLAPPAVSSPPDLELSPDGLSLLYTAGAWSGNPAPTITATLNIIGVGTFPATASMLIQPEWRGRNANVSESAINSQGGPIITQTPNLAIPTLPLDQQIEALLAGTQGCVWDPQDLSTLSQSHNTDVPVTAAGQPIGRMRSKYGAGGVRTFQQSSSTARGLLQTDGTILFDGIDDGLTGGIGTQNLPAATLAALCRPAAAGLSGDDAILFSQVNGTGSTNERALLRLAAGVPTLTCRRLDADPLTTVAGPDAFVADATRTIMGVMDFAGASPIAGLFVDNVEVGSSPISGTPGNTENTSSGRQGYGTRHTTMRFAGNLGRVFYAPFLLTPAQRATVDAWLREVTSPAPPPLMAEPWAQPTDASDLPAVGELREHNGQNWRNITPLGNLGEPGTYFGWEAVA
jgi:hypothetical protein